MYRRIIAQRLNIFFTSNSLFENRSNSVETLEAQIVLSISTVYTIHLWQHDRNISITVVRHGNIPWDKEALEL